MAPRIRRRVILTCMATVPKKSRRTNKRVRLAEPRIPDFDGRSVEEQVALLTKLIMENPRRPIYRVWSALDPVAHSVIVSKLGFFGEKVRAQRLEWARDDARELKRHTRMLTTFLKKQAEHESIAGRRPRFYLPYRYFAEPDGRRGTLKTMLEIEVAHLQWHIADINRILKQRARWNTRGIILAQEYVKRRAAFFGLPARVRLTPNAVADIYQLTRRTSDADNDLDTGENIRKAIAYYREKPENAYFIQNIEFYLDDWAMPISKSKSGN